MKQCSVRPYVGEQKYIYIAHSFKDKRFVYPVIEQLARDGYRVHFDEESKNVPEAANYVAEMIARCNIVLAFFSDNTVDSCSFKREVNFAVLKKKEIIAVMLEDVNLSPGIEMQMAAFPAIYKYKLSNTEFYKRLYSFEIMNLCLGEPNYSIEVSDENKYNDTLADLFGIDERRKPPIDDAIFIKASFFR